MSPKRGEIVKKNEIGDSEKAWSLVFVLLIFIGMILGALVGFLIGCFINGIPLNTLMNTPLNQMKGNHIWFYLVVPGSILGLPFFTIPIFLLFLKPFYTREAVSQFAVKGRREELQNHPLIIMLYKSTFFWIDVFFPEKNQGIKNESSQT